MNHKINIPIRTPDQRLRVFVSSTLKELSSERKIVKQAIKKLHLAPVMFESGARPHPAQNLYQAYLSQSHIFIGIYWQSYGWVGPGMKVSGLEDEFNRATGMPRLIYIKHPATDREPALKDLLERIRDENNISYTYFSTAEELADLVENDLILMLTERFEAISDREQAVEHPTPKKISNIPMPRNPLIGREKELKSACDLLLNEDVALLTLTGPGGTGKSRLGIQIGLEMQEYFPDGVVLVGLEAINDQQLVIPTIAKTLNVMDTTGGTSQLEALKISLSNKKVLLILDNFEQILPAAPKIAELLEACPNLKILITSRAPLHLRAEKELPVPPLVLPPKKTGVDSQPLAEYSAIKLFIQRAFAVNPDYPINDDNLKIISEICQRLDGLPLAIELAAGRSRMLSPKALLSRIGHRFNVLQGGAKDLPKRQHTMYDAIDWSYNLLDEFEKSLLRRLSVFSGGWTMEAANAICNLEDLSSSLVFEGIEKLIDNNILYIVGGDDEDCRMNMFETIREFASEQLAQSKREDTVIRKKHVKYYLEIAEQTDLEINGANQLKSLKLFDREIDNLRTALNHCLIHEKPLSLLRFCAALWRYWEIRGYNNEGRTWLDQGLSKNTGAPIKLKAKCLQGAGYLAFQQADYTQARTKHEESLDIFKELGDQAGYAEELDILGVIERQLGNYQRAVELHDESLTLRRLIDDKQGIAISLGHLGIVARDRGNFKEAFQLLDESLKISQAQDDRLITAFALNNLGLVAYYQSEYKRARYLLEESVSIYKQLNDRAGTSNALQNLGNIAKDQGCFQVAKHLYQECLDLKIELGDQGGSAQATTSMAEAAIFQGNYSEANDLARQGQILFEKLGIKRGVVFSLGIQAYAAVYTGEFELAHSLATKCLDIATAIDAPRAIAYTKMVFGLVAYALGELKVAEALFYEALDIFHKINDRRSIALLWVNLARTDYRLGSHNSARHLLEESLALARDLETAWTVGYSLEILGLVERDEGNHHLAYKYLYESLKLSIAQANHQGILNCTGALAGILLQDNQYGLATHLFSYAEKLRSTMRAKMGSLDLQEYNTYLNSLRQQMDIPSFNKAWTEGMAVEIEVIFQKLPVPEDVHTVDLIALDCLPALN